MAGRDPNLIKFVEIGDPFFRVSTPLVEYQSDIVFSGEGFEIATYGIVKEYRTSESFMDESPFRIASRSRYVGNLYPKFFKCGFVEITYDAETAAMYVA